MLPRRASLLLLSTAWQSAALSTIALHAWSIASTAVVSDGGARISTPGYSVGAPWAGATVPTTVLGALVDAGAFPDLFRNASAVDPAPYAVAGGWWYRSVGLTLPSTPSTRLLLRLKGVNYRANVWANGVRVADNTTVVGTFRYHTVDLTPVAVWGGGGGGGGETNALAIQVFPQHDRSLPATNGDLDLGITFVDWAPTPPDNNLGLWREAELLLLGGGVGLSDPGVFTSLRTPSPGGGGEGVPTFPTANLTVVVHAVNWDVTAAVQGSVTATVTTGDGNRILAVCTQAVLLPPGADVAVSLTPSACPSLTLLAPALWWPARMGTPTLHLLTVRVDVSLPGGGTVESDSVTTRFGVRTSTSELDENGHRLFRVNGQRVLFLGGGWSPDLLLRRNTTHTAVAVANTLAMGLGGIRLEGKMEPDDLFDMADETGLLMLPGWCCCDAWQHWPLWGPEQYAVAAESIRTQARRLRTHPSVLGFLLSSDELPPVEVEELYLNVTREEGWPAFAATVSAASTATSNLTGRTGVKMSGPYSWVPPAYWLQDGQGQHGLGGAWGFLTEGGPGEAPLTLESLSALVDPAHLWPPSPDDCWGHCGSPLGNFAFLQRFNTPLAARYGNATSLQDYLGKAALATYEGHRSMWDGYSRNRYAPATGVVQWMLNNAAPSNIWHLFAWDGTAGPSYYGTAHPLRDVHAVYGYDDGSVVLVNALPTAWPGVEAAECTSTVSAEVFGLRDEAWWNGSVAVAPGAAPRDGTLNISALGLLLPSTAQLQAWAGGYGMYMLRLRVLQACGSPAPPTLLDDAVYWLSLQPDVLAWGASTWWDTPVTEYGDLRAMADVLPPVTFDLTAVSGPALVVTPGGGAAVGVPPYVAWLAGRAGLESWTQVNVTVRVPAGTGGPAVLIRLRVLPFGASPTAPAPDPSPVYWTDNYFTLREGEERGVTALLPAAVLGGPGVAVRVAAECFNNRDAGPQLAR